MERSPEVPCCKKHSQQVQEPPPEPSEAEFCLSVLPRVMPDNNFPYAEPLPVGQNRNVAVQFAVHFYFFYNFFAIGFQTRVEIVYAYTSHERGHEVEKPGGDRFRDGIVSLLLPA